jgi:hypothetical protein
MTVAFEKFRQQYYSTGREKADGYTKSHFVGLSDKEKVKAFDMLAKELGANPDAVEWLFYLNQSKAEQFCLDYIQKDISKDKSGYFVLYYHLYKNSGDLKYQSNFINDFNSYPDYQKGVALEYLSRTKPTIELLNFLKSIISSRSDEGTADRAAYHLLRMHKVPGSTTEEQKIFFKFFDSLKNSEPSTRDTAIKEIERLFPIY